MLRCFTPQRISLQRRHSNSSRTGDILRGPQLLPHKLSGYDKRYQGYIDLTQIITTHQYNLIIATTE